MKNTIRAAWALLALLLLACPALAADAWFEWRQSDVGVAVYADTSVAGANAMHVAVQYRALGEAQSRVAGGLAMRAPLAGATGYTVVYVVAVPAGAAVEKVQVVPATLHLPGAQADHPQPGVRY